MPIWVKQNRLYFIGKSEELKLLKNYVKRGDWDKAIEIWKSATDHEDYKVVRVPYYNLHLFLRNQRKIRYCDKLSKKGKLEQMGEKRATSYISTLKKEKTR